MSSILTSQENKKVAEPIVCENNQANCVFAEEIASLRKEVEYLHQQVRTDGLTGLYNFRFFNEALMLEIERAIRTAQPLSLIMLDIDYFKKFNDQWGHDGGNQALVHVANMIKIAVRKLDLPCRYGGEEFAILLPNTDLKPANNVAERLRDIIATTPVNINQTDVYVTASLGVDQFSIRQGETSDTFLKRVDALLYQAKEQGRNKVVHGVLEMKENKPSVSQDEKDILYGVFDSKE